MSRLNWSTPADEWERLREATEEDPVYTGRTLTEAATRAMTEWLDMDGLEAAEQRLNDLLRAGGHTVSESVNEKTSSRSPVGEERTLAAVEVPCDVKQEFIAAADEADENPGLLLARAIREFLDGGRTRRITERVERVEEKLLPIIEAVKDKGERVNPVESRTINIAARLGDVFSQDDLDEAIRAAGWGQSDEGLEKYRKRVLEHKEMVTHPRNDSLYATREEARRIEKAMEEERREQAEQEAAAEEVRMGTDSGTEEQEAAEDTERKDPLFSRPADKDESSAVAKLRAELGDDGGDAIRADGGEPIAHQDGERDSVGSLSEEKADEAQTAIEREVATDVVEGSLGDANPGGETPKPPDSSPDSGENE